MSDTWSGAIIYEWVQETNDYGLVTYPNGNIYSGAPIPMQPDFDTLSSLWAGIKPSPVQQSAYKPDVITPACPGQSEGWEVNGDVPLPRLGSDVLSAAVASVKHTVAASPSSTMLASTTSGGSSSSMTTGTFTAAADSSSKTAASTSKGAGSQVVVPALGSGLVWVLGLLL